MNESKNTGDALAALEEIEEALLGAANHIQDSFDGIVEGVKGSATTDPLMRAHGRIDEVRRHLTASGVPDSEALEAFNNLASHGWMFWKGVYRQEAEDIVRHALRNRHGGVLYVPDEVRRLPDRMDREANARDDGDFISDRERGTAEASRYWAESLREALDSAPADGYKLVPVEPTQAMRDALSGRVVSGSDAARRVYAGLIAAAPQRGGEDDR